MSKARPFGTLNYSVLAVYLLGMLGVGAYFANKNKDTDDYFRGGQKILWWAAGCSIFATMLSLITYMAIPAKAYAQDWVYLVGNLTILAAAPVAVYLALPFFGAMKGVCGLVKPTPKKNGWSDTLMNFAAASAYLRMGRSLKPLPVMA